MRLLPRLGRKKITKRKLKKAFQSLTSDEKAELNRIISADVKQCVESIPADERKALAAKHGEKAVVKKIWGLVALRVISRNIAAKLNLDPTQFAATLGIGAVGAVGASSFVESANQFSASLSPDAQAMFAPLLQNIENNFTPSDADLSEITSSVDFDVSGVVEDPGVFEEIIEFLREFF